MSTSLRIPIPFILSAGLLFTAHAGKTQTTVAVPLDAGTIQAGINQAQDGDTVLVAPGSYFENLVIYAKDIVLASHYILPGADTSFIPQTVIDGGGSGNVLQIREGAKSMILGFTITNGHTDVNHPGGNIYCYKSSPVIKDNIISNGIGDGNYFWSYQKHGGGIYIEDASPLVAGNTIIDNHAFENGGGIFITGYSSPQIIGNFIKNNDAKWKGAIGGGSFCKIIILQNIIDGNMSTDQWYGSGTTGGISLSNSFGVIENNTIVNNLSPSPNGRGGGIRINGTIDAGFMIRNNIIYNNQATSGGGVYCSNGADVVLEYNNVYNNTGGNYTICLPDSASISALPGFVDFANGDYRLAVGSPCIDAGNPDAAYNDPEDPANPGMALTPSRGAVTNDMGAFGGPLFELDFDRDGLSDATELGLAPPTNPILTDTDGDGALDLEELQLHSTQPTVADSDNDNFADGFEVEMGTNPNDDNSFPLMVKPMNFNLLVQEARQLAQQPYDTLAFYPVPQLDPPQKPGPQTLGMVFQEALAISVVNLLDPDGVTYCKGAPRAGLDRTKVRIYTDDDQDGNYNLRSYGDAMPAYSSPYITSQMDTIFITPPIDTALLPAVGKHLVKLIVGHLHPVDGGYPQLFDFGGTGYARFSEYDGIYGASYRVATNRVFQPGEDFPEFREFYYHIDDENQSTLLGKADAEGFSGAVQYTLIPGFVSDMQTKAAFFPRTQLASGEMGVVGYSSMFWKDQDSTVAITNDEAHDSDWLVVGYDQDGDGDADQFVEHEIVNPDSATQLITTDFDGMASGEQVYFALENRDREEAHYTQYAAAEYHLRSSYSIRITNSNVPLSLVFYEQHTESEYNDNIAMEVAAKTALSSADTVRVEYITRAYKPGQDLDQDGVHDGIDNCPETYNPGHADSDGDGIGDACGEGLLAAPVLFLQGPYDSSAGLMQDGLRTNGLLPLDEPYAALGFTQVGGGEESAVQAVFDVSTADAIVDWVFLELRDGADSSVVAATRSALLQRDGDVVDVDGISPVFFGGLLPGDYYLAVRHRNHLGVMSAAPVALSKTATVVDFTASLSQSFGGANGIGTLGDGNLGLYSGDLDRNGQVQNTDYAAMVLTLGTAGYLPGDLDLNGQVQNTDVQFRLLPNLGKGQQFP